MYNIVHSTTSVQCHMAHKAVTNTYQLEISLNQIQVFYRRDIEGGGYPLVKAICESEFYFLIFVAVQCEC